MKTNPSPELIKFLDNWRKKQKKTLKKAREKYEKILKNK